MKLTAPLTEPIPTRADGTPWPFMLLRGGLATGADSATELVGELIAGYDEIPTDDEGHDAASWQRALSSVQIAGQFQEGLMAKATEDGSFNVAEAGEDVLTAMLGDKSQPLHAFPVTDDGPKTTVWNQPVPLVLLATLYAPYTGVPAPTGRIAWIDPATETFYLESLASLGLLTFLVSESAAGEAA